MSEQQSIDTTVSLTSSSNGRVSGKSWKAPRSATFRTLCSTGHKSKFEERMKKTTKHNAVKKLETELREEKHAEKQRRREITAERKKAAEERRRIEEDKAKMGARKAARLRRKAGRTKKIHG